MNSHTTSTYLHLKQRVSRFSGYHTIKFNKFRFNVRAVLGVS